MGLGRVLNLGVLECSNNIIARMDTDDICHYSRFEKQILFMLSYPDVDVVGSWINELEESDSDMYILGTRKVPESDKEIKKFHKKRNALNHMTVVFRKDKVLEAGNYMDMPFFEDYYLWSRMMLKKMKFYNFQFSLVYARVDNNMIGRRHGWKYAQKELSYIKKAYSMNFISFFSFIQIILIRIPLRLVPVKILENLYNIGARSKVNN